MLDGLTAGVHLDELHDRVGECFRYGSPAVDDLWSHAFDAVVAYVRAALERRQLPIATICEALRDQT